jgi:excisionase family DNA binding protein
MSNRRQRTARPGSTCLSYAGGLLEGRLMDQLVSVKQAANILACSEQAIRKWISQQRFPVVKVGRLIRLRLEDLERVTSHGLEPPRR